MEVKHLADRIGKRVKRAAANACASEPVVFDETDNGSLIRHGVVHEIALGPRGDDDQRLARTVAATSLRMRIRRGIGAGKRGAAVTTSVGSREGVRRGSGLVDDRGHNVVVPTVRVVIQNHYCSALPERRFLEEIDHVYDEGLLVQRVRIAGVAILERWSLQEVYGWEVAGAHGSIEVIDVIVVIRLTTVTNFSDIGWPGMCWVGRRSPVLEKRMVGNIVASGGGDACRSASAALRPIGICDRQVEATHERAPAHAGTVQEIADVLAGQLHLVARGSGANVANRIRVANNSERTTAAVGLTSRSIEVRCQAVRLPRNKINQPRSGRAKGRAVGIVAHCKMLSVVPESSDGVAVEVSEVKTFGSRDWRSIRWRASSANIQGEEVHQAHVHSGLLGSIGVILIVRGRLRTVKPERIRSACQVRRVQVGVVCEQPAGKSIDGWGSPLRMEGRLAWGIQGVWIRAEVMIERDVLLKDNHYVLDWSSGVAVGICRCHWHQADRGCRCNRQRLSNAMMHKLVLLDRGYRSL